jgi:hypothetical protein
MKTGADDETIAWLAMMFREEARLSVIPEDGKIRRPTSICSLSLTGGATSGD